VKVKHSAIVIAVVASITGALASMAAADALADLGIKEPEAKVRVMEALNSGYINYQPAGKALKAAAPAGRETLVKGALAWARSYTESAEFRDAYLKLRDSRKPASRTMGGSGDQAAQQRASIEKGIAEAKKNLASLPASLSPEMRKTMEASLKQVIETLTAQLAEMDKPEYQAMMKQASDASNVSAQREDEQRQKDYESRYPSDPRAFVARRIRQFLEESATVDFGAKLVSSGSVMRFADPKYEQKSANWKLCYRAGSGTVNAAREFAAAWLADLEKR
jgi:hypothetical protein